MNVNPPWLQPSTPGRNFTIPGVDNVPDLHGDIVDPQLVIFFNGNQFMVVPDLIRAFKRQNPDVQRVFVETLPPGVLVDQIEQGALIIGNVRITLASDILTAGKKRIQQLECEKAWVEKSQEYARNTLGIMVRKGNPKGIHGLKDLGRDEIQVSMPNPQIEGVGELIVKAYERAGGQTLVDKIMHQKIGDGSAFLTQIHHRQTPMRILQGLSDVGPVWRTEALFQQRIGNQIELVEIPEDHNQVGIYCAALLKSAPHPELARHFLDFLMTPSAQQIYNDFGFQSVLGED